MTTTITTQALANYKKAAEQILALIDDLGFTTERTFDSADLIDRIVGTIVLSTQSDDVIECECCCEQEPTDEDMEKMLSELAEEQENNRPRVMKVTNVCPECGQLVR